ncbi:MAG TPA: hypothetical protein VIS48_15895 [Candidatus Kryptonia bacterium]
MKIGLSVLAAAVLFVGCNQKSNIVDPSTLPKATGQVVSDTNYIQIQPAWTAFSSPKDIKIGYDDFLYVTEPGKNRVAMANLAGTILGYSQYIERPVAVTEDRRFNLIVACEYDTMVNGNVVTVAAIAKLRLFNHSDSIWAAPVEIVYHENPRQQITRDGSGNLISGREFTGIAVLPDNSYYVTRSGKNNSSSVDPDNMILHFDKNDDEYSSDYIDLVPTLVSTGTGFVAINQISNITTFNTRQYGTDFILTQTDPANAFKVKWITFNPGSELFAPSWDSRFSLNPTTYSSGKLPDILSGIFVAPQAVMVDDRSNIYIIDSQLDSLMKFDLNGRLLRESFGPVKSGSMPLLHPSGITYFNKIIYISDTGHNRVLRYELSTDLK